MNNLECYKQKCENCEHWVNERCDTDLVTEEIAREYMKDNGENEYGANEIIDCIGYRLQNLTMDKFKAICRDFWEF